MAKLNITLVRSTASANKRQLATVKAMGLRKIGSSVQLEDNPATKGMIRKVEHLVKVEEA